MGCFLLFVSLRIYFGDIGRACLSESTVKQCHELKEIQIPVDWHVPEDFPSPYASNMFAQAGEYEIVLSFFQTKLPLLTGTPEENKAKLEELESVRAECVSRIIVN